MKTYLVLLLGMFLFIACEDDDNSISDANQRINNVTAYDSNGIEILKTEFSYSGSRVSRMSSYELNEDKQLVLSNYKEYTYGTNIITEETFELIDDNMEKVSSAQRLIEGSKTTEISTIFIEDGSFDEKIAKSYQYEEGKLVSWSMTGTEDLGSDSQDLSKTSISYNGDNIDESISSNLVREAWIFSIKQKYSYIANLVSDVIIYNYYQDWQKFFKYEYQYAGNQVRSIKMLVIDYETDSWKDFLSARYEYNSLGLVSKGLDGDGNSFNYSYEEGIGNVSEVIYTPEMELTPGIRLKSTDKRKNLLLQKQILKMIQ